MPKLLTSIFKGIRQQKSVASVQDAADALGCMVRLLISGAQLRIALESVIETGIVHRLSTYVSDAA